MAIQLKRGLAANLPSSALSGEPLWTTDTNGLYVGTGGSVVQVPTTSTTPAFDATYAGSTSLSNGAFTKVLFATEVSDTNSNYDDSTSVFTPTVAGYYQINASIDVSVTGTATAVIVSLFKNGSEFRRGHRVSATDNLGAGISTIIYMNGTTDFLDIRVFQNSGASGSTGSNTWFNGCLVRNA